VPPENGAFMVAAYVAAATILVVYSVSLVVRLRAVGKKGSS
jgi:hypothetical protein